MPRIIIQILINIRLKLPPKKLYIFILKNNLILSLLNKTSIAYSLKKIKTNPTEAYSTLNPDTNSLSPSAKSKGVRFDSAIVETIHKSIRLGKDNRITLQDKLIWKKSNLLFKLIKIIIKRPNLIS